MTVPRARSQAGRNISGGRREIARGLTVELPERTAGGWQVRWYSPLSWPVYVGRHRAEKRRAKHRAKRWGWS